MVGFLREMMCHRVCVERAGFEPSGGDLDQIPKGVKAPKQECCNRKLVRSEHDLARSYCVISLKYVDLSRPPQPRSLLCGPQLCLNFPEVPLRSRIAQPSTSAAQEYINLERTGILVSSAHGWTCLVCSPWGWRGRSVGVG